MGNWFYCSQVGLVITMDERLLYFPSLAAIMIFSFINSFIQETFIYLLYVGFVIGFFLPGDIVQFFVLISEYVGPKRRAFAAIFPMFLTAISYLILALKAYYIRQWRYIFIACTAPYVLVIPYHCFYKFVPESVRWLRLHGRTDEMMKIF